MVYRKDGLRLDSLHYIKSGAEGDWVKKLSMGFAELFVVSSVPVLKLLLLTTIGSILSTNAVDILGEVARKNLNNVVFFVFNPALVAVNIAQTITFESMVQLWFMPVNILLTYAIGSLLGWIVIQMTKPPSHLKGLVLGCCSAGNLGSMILIIVPAICKEKGSPFGDPSVCHTYGMAYCSLSMAFGGIFLWSIVYNIVRISSDVGKESLNNSSQGTGLADEAVWLLQENCSADTDRMQDSISGKVKHILAKLSSGTVSLKKLFAPSTIGVIVGFVVGVIPQFKRLIIGGTAPLHVIQDSTALLADGAIPSITLILGANLTKGLLRSDFQLSIVVGVVVARYVALPMLGILVIRWAIRFGLVYSDPLFRFVLLLQYSVPPAINIGTITQLFGAGESECSVILLWAYGLASISLTLWSTLFLWFVS